VERITYPSDWICDILTAAGPSGFIAYASAIVSRVAACSPPPPLTTRRPPSRSATSTCAHMACLRDSDPARNARSPSLSNLSDRFSRPCPCCYSSP
jgi:hypothetical protein